MLGKDRAGGNHRTHLANSSTLSSRTCAGDSIAQSGTVRTVLILRLLTIVVINIQVTKVNDVIILILKAEFLSQTP